MEPINVVFEDDYADVDIILVPDSLRESIEEYLQQFFNWAIAPENRSNFEVTNPKGDKIVSIGTVEFICWLNEYVCNNLQPAIILKQHTAFLEDAPVIEF